MVAKTNVLQSYKEANIAGKVEIICKYYTDFIGIIEGFTEGLRYMIENEKAYNQKAQKGELGVRVQGGRSHSDVTADAAINHVVTREAIVTCDFSGNIFEGVDHKKEYQERAVLLKHMRDDFELFNRQLVILGQEELRVFRSYLTREKDLTCIADEEGIQYESAAQKVRRAKVKIKIQMACFMEGVAV